CLRCPQHGAACCGGKPCGERRDRSSRENDQRNRSRLRADDSGTAVRECGLRRSVPRPNPHLLALRLQEQPPPRWIEGAPAPNASLWIVLFYPTPASEGRFFDRIQRCGGP